MLSAVGYGVRISKDSRLGYSGGRKRLRTSNLAPEAIPRILGYLSTDDITYWGKVTSAAFIPVGMAADLDDEGALLIKFCSITKGIIPISNYLNSNMILGTFTFYRRYRLMEQVEQNWFQNQPVLSDKDVGTYFTPEEVY